MKKLLLPLLAVLILISCDEESSPNLVLKENIAENSYESGSTNARKSNKIDVCHKGKIINISINAITAHQDHGDAVDMDGDGYFDIDNPCSETDCDDTDGTVNPAMEEVCDNGIDDNCNEEIDENCSDPCLEDAINQGEAWIIGLGGELISTTITGSTTFTVYFYQKDRNGRDACYINYMEATGTPETECGFTFSTHELVPCQ